MFDQRAAGVAGVDRGVGLDGVQHGVLLLSRLLALLLTAAEPTEAAAELATAPSALALALTLLALVQLVADVDRPVIEDTMPAVTVPARSNGEPMATTCWPIWRLLEVPRVAVGSPVTFWALITATSVVGSRPMILAGVDLPFWKSTSIWPPPIAEAITWLLVMISPSEETMKPEPSPSWVLISTTVGSTLLATSVTEPGVALDAFWVGALENSEL